MSAQLLLAIAVAGLPLSLLGWIAGRLTDRWTLDPTPRGWVWGVALWSPALLLLAALGALIVPSPALPPLPTVIPATPVVAPLEVVAAPNAATAINPQTLATVILALLAFGTALRVLRLAVRARRLAKSTSAAAPPPAELGSAFASLARSVGASRCQLRVCVSISAPLLAGLVRPAVVLPAAWLERSQAVLLLVCAHELAHLKAGHHRWLWAEEVLLALFWFNPLLQLIRRGLAAAREEACDAAALVNATYGDRRAYADALLHALRPAAGRELAISFGGQGKAGAMRRLNAILSAVPSAGKGVRFIASFVALGAVLSSAGVAIALTQASTGARPARADTRVSVVRCERAADGSMTNCRADPTAPQPAEASAAQSFVLRCRRSPDGREACDAPAPTSELQPLTADALQQQCRDNEPFCGGLLFGLAAAERQRPSGAFCPPSEGSENEILSRAKSIIAGGRPATDESGAAYARRALQQAFPCREAATARRRSASRVSIDGFELPNGFPLSALTVEGTTMSVVQEDASEHVRLTSGLSQAEADVARVQRGRNGRFSVDGYELPAGFPLRAVRIQGQRIEADQNGDVRVFTSSADAAPAS